ncbi:hypothetical protein [Thermococcus chitonophagus]|uniref:hypothetical protein n=1 Tax=Thermococcus chitonophagus TaxID=54262 RepID=UPI0012FFA876|nr:hypothetical protein [Thermococcus chitonophagus]
MVLSNGTITIFRGDKKYRVCYPTAYPLEWGFIGINDSKLYAYTYSGEPLWNYTLNSTKFGIAVTPNYLFLLIPADEDPQGTNVLYIFGKTGLLAEHSFPNIYYPLRCFFLKSRGNYTLLLLDHPQADGSAGMGRVIVFKGEKIAFEKTFTFRDSIEDPVYCVGDISPTGMAAFGLYHGVGILDLNSTIRYFEFPPYGVDDVAIVGDRVFALVSRETPSFYVVRDLVMIDKAPTFIMKNLSKRAELFSSGELLLVTDPWKEKAYIFSPTGKLQRTIEYHQEIVVEGEKLLLCSVKGCTPIG